MSLVNIKARKISESDSSVEYDVTSIDFSKNKEWKSLGVLSVKKANDEYEFSMSQYALDQKMIPPRLAANSDIATIEMFCKLWSLKIHHYGKTILKARGYPSEFP